MSSGDESQASKKGPADPRPELLLKHLAMYGVTVRAIASKLLCENSASKTENLFGRLLKQKRIHAFSLRKNPRLSYYTLSPPEAARLGAVIPTGRLSGRAIHEAIAILYYCHTGTAPRRHATGKRLERRLPFPLKTSLAPFVVQDDPAPFIGRVIVPGYDTRTDYAMKIIREESTYLQRFPKAREWLVEGLFRFVVLTHSAPRQTLFAEAVTKAKQLQRLPEHVRVDVEHVEHPLGTRPPQEIRS